MSFATLKLTLNLLQMALFSWGLLKWPKSAIWSKLGFYYWWHFLVGPICATTYRHVVFWSNGISLQMALVALLALVALFGCIRLYAASIEAIYWRSVENPRALCSKIYSDNPGCLEAAHKILLRTHSHSLGIDYVQKWATLSGMYEKYNADVT